VLVVKNIKAPGCFSSSRETATGALRKKVYNAVFNIKEKIKKINSQK
jgi:hypothetical protein